MKRCSPKTALNVLTNSHHREMMNKGYHYTHIWLVEKLYGYNVFAKSQFFPTAKEYILINYHGGC